MIHLLSVSAIILSSIAAASSSNSWQADYGKALAATRTDSRPLLIILDVPSDPKLAARSKQLETTGEQSELLGAYQRCRIDVSTEYGKKIAKIFGAKEFPFTVIIDKTGSVVLCKKTGQLTEEQWHATLATYQKGEQQAPTIHTAFYRGAGTMFDTNDGSTKIAIPSAAHAN
ncbi:MAG: hypothetical protein GXP28_08150 [Planctomycetes bacterium]|nr:hypothetical protein [Planctomycetota bacterium]